MFNISNISQMLSTALDGVRQKLVSIPGIMLQCTCCRRPGFSSIVTSAKIYADMRETDNDEIVKSFTYNMVNKIKENIQEDGVAFIAIKPNDIQFQLTGGNAGGPITLVGSNKNCVGNNRR